MCEYDPQLRPNYDSPVSALHLEEVLNEHLSSNVSEYTAVDLEESFDSCTRSRRLPRCSHKHFYHQVIRPLWPTIVFYRL